MLKKSWLLLLLIICSYNLSGQISGEEALVKAMHSITSEELMQFVKIQCDDKYEGRLTGTPGYQACAEWMMGVAKALAVNKIPIKRSVMFLGFGSEEQALAGSRTYVKYPLFPLEKSVLINMDGVGCGSSFSANAGRDFPVLWSFIENANKDYIHRTIITNSFPNLGRPRLDASIFLKEGVPSLSFAAFGAPSPYHVPQDNIDIINPETMEDLAQMLFIAVARMANSKTPLR
jgi:hypothetical protein